MDATEAIADGQNFASSQQPTTSSPFRSPAPPLMTSFEGILSTVAAFVPPELADLNIKTPVMATTAEEETKSTEDLEESISSNSSSKRGRARRRKKALYAKIRDQIAYYFSDANLRHDRFMRSLAGVEEETQMNCYNDYQNKQEKKTSKVGQKRKFDNEGSLFDREMYDNENYGSAKKTVTFNVGNEEKNISCNEDSLNDPSAKQVGLSPSSEKLQSASHLSGCLPVPCSAFLAFNKIASLLGNRNNGRNGPQKEDEDIYRAFLYEHEWTAYGTPLVFDAKNRTIARREPFSNDSAVAERVIYVEGFCGDQLPIYEQQAASETSSTNEMNVSSENLECDDEIYKLLKKTFEEHGTVLSIRTPRFKGTKQLMGFAFVEFADKEAVERSVKHFKKLLKNDKQEAMEKIVSLDAETDTFSNENNAEFCNKSSDNVKLGMPLTGSNESLSNLQLQNDDDNNMNKGIKRKQNINEENSGNFENTTNETDSMAKPKLKKVKLVKFENEFIVENKDDNVATVDETIADQNDKSKQNTSDKSPFNLNQLRVMSKQRWNQYKNRYLKLQRSVAPQNNRFAMNDDYHCSDLLVNLDLIKKRQQSKKKPISNNSPKVTHQSGKNSSFSKHTDSFQANVESTSTSNSNIVQLVLQTNKAQSIESGRIRRSLRNFFETAHSKFADSRSDLPPLPSTSDIAFIDCEQRIHFQADGSMQLTAFIRTHNAESAAKMVLNDDYDVNEDSINEQSTAKSAKNFRQLLNVHLGSGVTLKKVVLLDKTAIDNYWALVNQSKGRNSYNNCNYNYQEKNFHTSRNARKNKQKT